MKLHSAKQQKQPAQRCGTYCSTEFKAFLIQ